MYSQLNTQLSQLYVDSLDENEVGYFRVIRNMGVYFYAEITEYGLVYVEDRSGVKSDLFDTTSLSLEKFLRYGRDFYDEILVE